MKLCYGIIHATNQVGYVIAIVQLPGIYSSIYQLCPQAAPSDLISKLP